MDVISVRDDVPIKITRKYLSIGKRDADCYDVSDGETRVAALRSDYTEDDKGVRTMTPGTWRIRWEFHDGIPYDLNRHGRLIKLPDAIAGLRFGSAHAAFAFLCEQVLD